MAEPETLSRPFASGLLVKIQHCLFSHPGKSFHISHVASYLDDYPATVSRELSSLAQAGLLTSFRIDNQRHSTFALESPTLEDLRGIFINTHGSSAARRICRQGLRVMDRSVLKFLAGNLE